MAHVLERDGIAACPDDPARTGSPDDGMTAAEEASLEKLEVIYTLATQLNIKDALTGRRTGAAILHDGQLHCYATKDIAEVLHDSLDHDDITVLLAGYIDPERAEDATALVNKLIDDLAVRSGERLAAVHMGNQP